MFRRKEIKEHRPQAEGAKGASHLSRYLLQEGEPDPFFVTFETRRAVKLNPQHFLSDHLSYITINVIGTGPETSISFYKFNLPMDTCLCPLVDQLLTMMARTYEETII